VRAVRAGGRGADRAAHARPSIPSHMYKPRGTRTRRSFGRDEGTGEVDGHGRGEVFGRSRGRRGGRGVADGRPSGSAKAKAGPSVRRLHLPLEHVCLDQLAGRGHGHDRHGTAHRR
jgi:hypothetical protein